MDDLPLRCSCGRFTGSLQGLGPTTTCRVLCYCDDCQAYLTWLERRDLLDPHGGTAIVQCSAAALRLHTGREQIAALRLTERGILRFYASCCATPLCNTMLRPRVPFHGWVRSTIALDDATLTRRIGAARAVVQTRFATSNVPRERALPGVLGGLRVVAKSIWSGAAARDPLVRAGRPIVTPRVLDSKERRRLASR